MAPEQFQGRALPASDVYSIAATCVAMLTGTQPEDLPNRGLAIDVAGALRGRASAGLVSALTRMLDPDPERRAARVELPREARLARETRWDREAVRRARRDARREARRARRAQRRHGRSRRRWPIHFLFPVLLGLAVARVAVSLAMFVIVPLVLGILSLVFGQRLRDAAERVRSAGERAYEALDRAAQREQAEPDDARIRVEPVEPKEERIRFSDAGAGEESSDDEDEASEDEARRKGR
jgi:hypothetical protein